jgi:hypothetical protein
MKQRFLAVLTFCLADTLFGVDFSIQVVDGLGRMLSGVRVVVDCASSKARIRTESDEQGIARGTYDAAVCEPESVSVAKEGYEAYSSGFRQRYVVRRELNGAAELARVMKLDEADQLDALREILGSNISTAHQTFADRVFYHEARLRNDLRILAQEPMVAEAARALLSMIAVPEDVLFIMRLPTPSDSVGFEERWRYAVAAALVGSPDPMAESFLRRCALNQYQDRWVDAGAIETLMLTGSARSRTILEEAQRLNSFQASRIARALAYLDGGPPALSGPDLSVIAERVANAIRIGKWQGNGSPRFNEAGDKALVALTFRTESDRYGYEATFHRIEGEWTLRAAQQTYQAFAPTTVAPVRKR